MLLKKCRKVSFAIICFIICMLASITVFAASDNLLIDPDWDSGFDAWVDEAINATAVQNGKTLIYSKVYQDVALAEPAGEQKLVLSAYLRAREGQEYIDMGLIICKEDGSHISDLMESESGTEWAYHEIATEVPPEASYARVYLTIWKNDDDNTFGFDDLCLTENTDSPVLTVDEPDRTCKGQWVFDKTVSWTGTSDTRAQFNSELNQAMLFFPNNGVTFVAVCGAPDKIIEGGETVLFPLSMALSDSDIKEGYRFDSCWLGATALDIENPHNLALNPNTLHANFINIDDPKDDRAVCHGTVWHDPVDENNYGANLEEKTASWRFPYGVRDGETVTVWFVDEGESSTGPAFGWRYIWQSTSELQPLGEGKTDVNTEYDGNAGAWVLNSYDIHLEGKSSGPKDMMHAAAYLDEENDKLTLGYLKSDDKGQNWGFYETIYDLPPEIIPDKSKFTVNITTNSLGGYGYDLSYGASVSSGRNRENWEDVYGGTEMWDEEESRYYSSVFFRGWLMPDTLFKSIGKPFTLDLFRSGPNNAGDKLTIVYDAGPVIVFYYEWVEGTASE